MLTAAKLVLPALAAALFVWGAAWCVVRTLRPQMADTAAVGGEPPRSSKAMVAISFFIALPFQPCCDSRRHRFGNHARSQRVNSIEAKVFKLDANVIHAEAIGHRRKNFQRFFGNALALFGRHVV